MRIWLVVVAAVALGSILAGGVMLSYREPSPPPPAADAALTLPPEPSLLVPTLPAPAAAVSPQQLVEAPAPDLPTVDVSPRPEHVVPDHDLPARPVILPERERSAAIVARASPRAATPQVPSPPPPTAAIIAGKARLGEGVSLIVQGRAVALFGMRAPKQGDRCAVSDRLEPRACSAVAREVLASRLDVYGTVSCRVLSGQRDGAPGAICLDSTGVDLGGFLVAQGFGLADQAQSRNYVGAESAAASLHRGLWRFR